MVPYMQFNLFSRISLCTLPIHLETGETMSPGVLSEDACVNLVDAWCKAPGLGPGEDTQHQTPA